jgi:hypothetical protein
MCNVRDVLTCAVLNVRCATCFAVRRADVLMCVDVLTCDVLFSRSIF